MCRLILATGEFDADAVVAAAVAMSAGRTADHDGHIKVHPNGWGALWQDPENGTLMAHRDVRPLFDSWAESPVVGLDTKFLAVHSRHATLPQNQGLEFTHPLRRDSSPPWYFMHNGFLPTVHANLGLPASRFDSLEYFDYIIPNGSRRLDERETLARLRAIGPGGSSGNAVAANPEAAYVIHWSPPDVAAPRYFSMFRFQEAKFAVVASEVVSELAPPEIWSPVPADVLLKFPIADPRSKRPTGDRDHAQL